MSEIVPHSQQTYTFTLPARGPIEPVYLFDETHETEVPETVANTLRGVILQVDHRQFDVAEHGNRDEVVIELAVIYIALAENLKHGQMWRKAQKALSVDTSNRRGVAWVAIDMDVGYFREVVVPFPNHRIKQ